MALRVITLLLAVVVMMTAATASQADIASDDAASAVDDSPDVDTPIVPAIVAIPRPDQPELARVVADLPNDRGRVHPVHVFRPPRLVTSR